MPGIVNLPTGTPRARKRPGRDLAAVLAAAITEQPHAPRTAGLSDQPHLAYNPENPRREEDARALAPWARNRVGLEPFGRFGGYYTT